MAWNVSGRSVELCNCEMMCPCWLGPEKEPDKGWCAGAFAWDIQAGESNGVDLGGTKVAFRADWPNKKPPHASTSTELRVRTSGGSWTRFSVARPGGTSNSSGAP